MNLIPRPLLILDIIALLLFLCISITLIIVRIRLSKAMKEAIEGWNLYKEVRRPRIPSFLLQVFISTIERRSLSSGVDLLKLFGLEDALLKKLRVAGKRKKGRVPSPGDVRRALTFTPDQALFPVFILAQKKKRIRTIFEQWLDSAGELFVVRRLAIAADGARFNGEEASSFFYSRLKEVRALAGDPDYRARLFGLQIILTLDDGESRRLSYEALSDGHPEVRKLTLELYREESPEFKEMLLHHICEDPSPMVRDSAAIRLFATFPEASLPEEEKLDNLRALRVAEQLHPERKEDQDLALGLFKREDPELSLILSRFLDRSGAFARLFASADPGDREGMERAETILAKGGRYHCRSYMNILEQEEMVHPGPLLIASRILLQEGEAKLITFLLRRILSLPEQIAYRRDIREALLNTAEAAAVRGNEESRMILGSTLVSRYRDRELQVRVLKHLGEGGVEILLPPLLELITKPDYPEAELLVQELAKIPPRYTVHTLIDLIRNKNKPGPGAEGPGPEGRKRAIRILLIQGNALGLQHILEELPILEIEEAIDYARWLEQFVPAVLKEKIAHILSGSDALLRSRIMAVIPHSLCNDFRQVISAGLEDPEPEVRAAALHTLYKRFGETGQLTKLLYDPVPQVRKEAARISASSEKSYPELKKLILDPNEVEPVKEAALAGIAETDSLEGAELILDLLGKELEIAETVIKTAGMLSNPEAYRLFARRLPSAPGQLRERIIEALIEAGDKGKAALLSLLDETEPLRSGAAEALEALGVVDSAMRQLNSRRVTERLEAARLLISIGTPKALRGVVLLLKDPSEQVRLLTAKAIRTLRDQKGDAILDSLADDPVPRVRRYARWAKEHLIAEALD